MYLDYNILLNNSDHIIMIIILMMKKVHLYDDENGYTLNIYV